MKPKIFNIKFFPGADKKFLEFFFKRVKLNTSGRYEGDFPYISPCGRETNYIHCDDLPIVFSHLLDSQGQVVQDVTSFGESSSYALNHSSSDDSLNHSTSYNGVSTDQKTNEFVPRKEVQSTVEGHTPHLPLSLAYGGTLTLTVPFQPDSLCMLPASGRIYHRGPEKLGGVGLIKSSLAIELSQFFVYEEGAGEGSHPRGFHWQEKRWSLDSSLLPRLTQLTRNTS